MQNFSNVATFWDKTCNNSCQDKVPKRYNMISITYRYAKGSFVISSFRRFISNLLSQYVS